MSGNAEQVMARLVEAPERFDFFAALRIIEAAHAERARLGEGRRGGDEPVRLAQPPELAFPPGDIAGLDTPPGRPPRLRTHLMGLFGPHGPLPLHLTVRARERARREQDTTLADFCDVFHHRMLAFFYRAWAAARPVVAQDRPGDDRFAHRVGALAGLAHPAFADRHALPDRFALYGVSHAFYWTYPKKPKPAYWAFRAYRNYDGNGGHFLDRIVPTTSPSGVSLFASRDEAGKKWVLVALNFSADRPFDASIALNGCAQPSGVKSFVYTGGEQGFVAGDAKVEGSSLKAKLPTTSITVVELTMP